MNQIFFRLAAVFCLVGLGSLAFHRFACHRPIAGEPGPHLLPAAVGEYLDGVALSVDLQARLERNHRRLHAKHAVVTELLAGELTLLAAAARFAELDADVPEVRDRLAQQYPGVSAEVARCRQVIEHARSVLRVRAPEQVDGMVACLEAELQAHQEAEAGPPRP